jgi:glycosyltransferase 2 family protein
MQPPKPKFTWKTVLFPLLGLVGFFLYIYLFHVDILGIIATAQTANPLIYAVAVVFGLLEVLFFSVSWRELTNFLSIKMSITRAYLYVWYGLYVDTLVPAQSISGEVTRTYLLMRDKCGSTGKIVASLFAHRLLGMAVNVIALVVGVVLLYFGGQASPLVFNLIIAVTAAITAIITLMVILALKQPWTLKIINWATKLGQAVTFGRWKPGKLKDDAIEITRHFHDSMKEFRNNPKPIAASLFYLTITWIFSLSVPYLVFQSLGHPVSWSLILITSSIVLAVKAVPVGIPFEVGLPEAVMTTLYFSMGVPVALSATATILVRIITLWLRFFIGFASQQYLELKPVIAPTADMEKTKNKTHTY